MKLLFLCLLAGRLVFAQQMLSQDSAQFDATVPVVGNIYFTQKILSFSDWAKSSPVERTQLALYPEYEEPVVTVVKNGQRQTQQEHLMVFVMHAKFIFNKKAEQVDLKPLINLDTIAKFDPEIEHRQIQPAQFMANVVHESKITNFQWCNEKTVNISRPARELDLSYTNPKNRAWCSDSEHTVCVESCFLFGKYWSEGVKLVNLALSADEKKDFGIAMQSEIRILTGEDHLPVQQLTQIKAPLRGGFEQNMFYFNQVMEFGKVLALLQNLPSDSSQTLATVYIVFGIKKRSYDQWSELRKILMSQSTLFNTSSGITAGLPVFSQNFVRAMAEILQN